MPAQETIESLLEAYERSLFEPDARNPEAVSQRLADTFVEFGSSGRAYTKAQVLASLQAAPQQPVSASQFQVRLLAPHVALVTYRTRRDSEPPAHALRSSIWEQREGQWQMIFHQGTPAQDPS